MYLSQFSQKKTFAFTKQTFPQTNYNIYEFMILLNNLTYFRASFFVTPQNLHKKLFIMKPFKRKDFFYKEPFTFPCWLG